MPTIEFPFYYKTHTSKGNGGFPEILPFNMYFDSALGIIRQKNTKKLENCLYEIYRDGSLVEGSVSSESGNIYAEKTYDYIKTNFPDLKKADVLEVGCGKGVLLKKFQTEVNSIIGIDPGNHGLIEGIENIKVIQDFFPSNKIVEKFDLIYHFGVLEHLENPTQFLLDQKKHLKDNGVIILGVPNCEPYFETGDISMFIHEHFSYFSAKGLISLANEVNMELLNISVIEGMLFCCLRLNAQFKDQKQLNNTDNFDEFNKKANNFLVKLNNVFKNFSQPDIAVYAGGRALNILYQLNMKNVRLIDDSSELLGKYLPFLENPIENFEGLLNNPPKLLLIFSRTFGRAIAEKCKRMPELYKTQIVSVADV